MKYTNYLVTIAGLLLLFMTFTLPASAQQTATGSPELDINIDDNELKPGEVSQVVVELENNAEVSGVPSEVEDLLTTAEDVNVKVSDVGDDDIEAEIIEGISGNISQGSSEELTLEINVPKEFEDDFTVFLDLEYEYSDLVEYEENPLNITNIENETETENRAIDFETEDIPVIQIDGVDKDVSVGESDRVEVFVTNVGSEDAESLNIENLRSGNQQLEVGDGSSSYFIGDLNSGSTSTINVLFEYSDTSSSNQDYILEGTANYDYRSEEGNDDLELVVSPDEERDFGVDIQNERLQVGGVGRLDIELQNSNDLDLSDVSVDLTATDNSVAFNGVPGSGVRSPGTQTQTRYVGEWEFGEEIVISSDVGFSESAVQDDSYLIDVQVNYETSEGVENTISENLAVSPSGERDIDLEVQDSNIPVDGFGEFNLSVDNRENFDIEDAELSLTNRGSNFIFGTRASTASSFIGELNSDESELVTFKGQFSPDSVSSQNYPIMAVLTYEDVDGIESTIEKQLSISPVGEQGIAIEKNNFDLSEGESSDISFDIGNVGPKDLEEVDVTVTPRQDISIEQQTFTLGDISESESEVVDFSAEAPLESSSLTQEIEVEVEYTYENLPGTRTESKVLDVELNPLDSEFSVEANGSQIQQGGSGEVEITVTNNLEQTVSSLDGEFSASSPLSVNDESVFLETLGSGEEKTFNVGVSASGSASPNPYSLDVDFQYEDESGDTKLSEVYSVQVDVVESESNGLTGILVVGVVIVVAIIIIVAIARKRDTFDSVYGS